VTDIWLPNMAEEGGFDLGWKTHTHMKLLCWDSDVRLALRLKAVAKAAIGSIGLGYDVTKDLREADWNR
ncbi:hypothetical protein Tco_0750660, partial [Tanacetum coccineum]